MKKDSDSRRAFLQKVGAVAASLTIVPIAAGCGGGGTDTVTTASSGASGGAVAKVDCNDLSALTETDLNLRETIKYVAKTADPAKRCDNCQFYTATDKSCGACSIVKGPIHAEGYCMSWVAKPA